MKFNVENGKIKLWTGTTNKCKGIRETFCHHFDEAPCRQDSSGCVYLEPQICKPIEDAECHDFDEAM